MKSEGSLRSSLWLAWLAGLAGWTGWLDWRAGLVCANMYGRRHTCTLHYYHHNKVRSAVSSAFHQ